MARIFSIFAMPVLLGATALCAWGQGAVHEGMSFLAEPSYDGVHRLLLNPKTNTLESHAGWLMFDARDQVRFVNRSGGAQFRIPYRGIKSMECYFYNPIDAKPTTKWKSSFNPKYGGLRYLLVKFDAGYGLESSVMALDPDQFQQVMGSFQSKTGMIVARPGGYEKHW